MSDIIKSLSNTSTVERRPSTSLGLVTMDSRPNPSIQIDLPIFISDYDGLDGSIVIDGQPLLVGGMVYRIPIHAKRQLARAGIPSGLPFILNEDGSYNRLVNAFLRELADDGCDSPHSWKAYAYDLITFDRYLKREAQRAGLADARKEDFRAYHSQRRHSISGRRRVEVSTWQRQAMTLRRFYAWYSARCGVLNPFPPRRSRKPKTGWRTTGSMAGGAPTATGLIKFITLGQFDQFKQYGLLGLGSDPDDPYAGAADNRMRLRNVAFAELAVSSGLRLAENAAILLHELPKPTRSGKENALSFEPGKLTTKGSKWRRLFIPERVLTGELAEYLTLSRPRLVERAEATQRYSESSGKMERAHTFGSDHCINAPQGNKIPYHQLNVAERKRLFDVTDGRCEPAMLWLQENGFPAAAAAFASAFQRANEWMARHHGKDFGVTPHTLRHTYAVYTLSNLISAVVGSPDNLRKEKASVSADAYRDLVGDPLRTLQRWLGHSSVETTSIYLTYVEQENEVIQLALADWNARIDRLANLGASNG